MKSSISVANRKQNASFMIVGLMLAVAPLWLMLAAATSVHAQTSDDVFNSATTPSPADWTEFHRDNMQRWNPYETVLGVNNVGGLQVKWKNPIGRSGNLNSLASPVVVNGVVYFGSEDHNVYALNASTGAKLWSYTTGDVVVSSPAVANGVVYVGSFDSNVYALDANTGALLWRFTASNVVESGPTVANGAVYVGSIQFIYALNARTGALLWSHDEIEVASSPAAANGVVYVTAAGGANVDALDAGTGTLLWTYTVPGQSSNIVSSPAVANGLVYFGSDDGKVYALNASTGAVLWSFVTGRPVESSPAVANGVVYIGSDDGKVYALNASTGGVLWSFNTGSSPTDNNLSGIFGGVRSSPALANGVVYVGSDNGNLYALNAGTGAWLWGHYTGPAGRFSPVVVDGVVYGRAGHLGSGMGSVYAFSPGSAEQGSADLFLRIRPIPATVHPGDLITYTFPVWNLGPNNAVHEVLTTQVPQGTRFDYIRISGTPGLGKCTTPPYQQAGPIACFENSAMAPNTTWTVRLTVRVEDFLKAGTVITESATATEDTPDPKWANNIATVSTTVQ